MNALRLTPTEEIVTVKWFVYVGAEKIAKNSSMVGAWGFDAECSCGWSSATGGATESCVKQMVRSHKRSEHNYKII